MLNMSIWIGQMYPASFKLNTYFLSNTTTPSFYKVYASDDDVHIHFFRYETVREL